MKSTNRTLKSADKVLFVKMMRSEAKGGMLSAELYVASTGGAEAK